MYEPSVGEVQVGAHLTGPGQHRKPNFRSITMIKLYGACLDPHGHVFPSLPGNTQGPLSIYASSNTTQPRPKWSVPVTGLVAMSTMTTVHEQM